jgi:hypothetical protein
LEIAIGLIIGVAAGAAQLALLLLFAERVTRGGRFAAIGFAQWILPFAALAAVALFYREALLWAGTGAAATLVLGAALKTIFKGRRS